MPVAMSSLDPVPSSTQGSRARPKPAIKPTSATASTVDDKRDAALLSALIGLFSSSRKKRYAVGRSRKKVSVSQLLHLARRIVIVAAAIRYLYVSCDASIASLKVLNGVRNKPMKFEAYDSNLILGYVGETTVAESRLVVDTMRNDTTPRAYTYFLDGNGIVSTTNCSTPHFHSGVYSSAFLRLAIGGLMRDVSFHVSEFGTHEVVAPVVDCSFSPIQYGDETVVRVFYVMRNKATHDDIILASVRFSMQDYKILEQREHGPIGFSSTDIVRDMRAPQLKTYVNGMLGYPFDAPQLAPYIEKGFDAEGWWEFESKTRDSSNDAPQHIFTARRTGFYISADSEQANIKNLYWTINEPPKAALSKWNWEGEPVIKDSWAWIHLFHVGFALDVIYNLSVLLVVVYRNLQDGKIWLGDAFVSISSTLLVRGFLIVVSWQINGYWSLMEFCLHDAHQLAGTQEIFFHPQIMQADLLTMFFGLCSILGYLFRERIDPAFVIIVFEIFFDKRLDIIQAIPVAVATMKEFAQRDHVSAIVGVSETIAATSPMRQWTTHPLPNKTVEFVVACTGLANVGIAVVLIYIMVRKVWRHFHRQKLIKLDSKNTAAVSEDETSLLSAKRTLTLFEIATGAELQSRFGVISDYENCIFIKGMKYASADGIYSNGFVIVDGKYVVSSRDLFSIAMMKILRVQMRVYAYELKGNTVQQTARLVEHTTFTCSQLTHLNVMVLS